MEGTNPRVNESLLILFQPKGKYAFWFSVFRINLIPLLMLCNTEPRLHLPVLLKSDLIYAIIVVVLGLTNGYLANLSFVLMHKYVKSSYRKYPYVCEQFSIRICVYSDTPMTISATHRRRCRERSVQFVDEYTSG